MSAASDVQILIVEVMALDGLDNLFDRSGSLWDAEAAEIQLGNVKRAALRCGWVEGSEHFLTFARRRVESYGRAIADGWPQ